MRVLVVEDHEILARAIGTGLRREGMAVDVVLDGSDALGHLAVTRYDVVVLDRDLPGTHGDEVCRQLAAERAETRILMLTAASTVAARVHGLGLGADDYLPGAATLPCSRFFTWLGCGTYQAAKPPRRSARVSSG